MNDKEAARHILELANLGYTVELERNTPGSPFKFAVYVDKESISLGRSSWGQGDTWGEAYENLASGLYNRRCKGRPGEEER